MRRQESFDIIGEILKTQVDDRRSDRRSLETICMTNDPTAHEAAIAPAHHAPFGLIGHSHFYHVIDSGHQVEKILSTPITAIGRSEGRAITGGAARIRP